MFSQPRKALKANDKKMTMSATEPRELLQVILWTDVNEALVELSHTIEQRDVDSLLSDLHNETVFRQLNEIGARADLLKYEVLNFFFLNI